MADVSSAPRRRVSRACPRWNLRRRSMLMQVGVNGCGVSSGGSSSGGSKTLQRSTTASAMTQLNLLCYCQAPPRRTSGRAHQPRLCPPPRALWSGCGVSGCGVRSWPPPRVPRPPSPLMEVWERRWLIRVCTRHEVVCSVTTDGLGAGHVSFSCIVNVASRVALSRDHETTRYSRRFGPRFG